MKLPRAGWELRSALSTWLPVLLMLLLALGTWWLVKNTPGEASDRTPAAPRHEPDYTMRDFTVQRFGSDGALRVRIVGDVMRHYPDTDTLEIDKVDVRATAEDGRVTRATARSALANGAATEVQLKGGAEIVQEAFGNQTAMTMQSEFLHFFLDSERVRSHLPVVVTQGRTVVRAESFEYDHLAQTIQLKGKVKASFAPRARSAAPP